MKQAYYFSHDSNAKDDPKIIKLRIKHGWKGYGVFWALVEMLRDQDSFKMQTDYDSIAFALREDSETIKSVINDFDLFIIDSEFFHSESLLKRMQLKEEKSEKARDAANKRWKKENKANAMQTHSERNANPMQLKESKEKESKIEKGFFSFKDIESEFFKEKPMKRPYFIRMSELHSLPMAEIQKLFSEWKLKNEGKEMTVHHAENSFNLFIKGNSLKAKEPQTDKIVLERSKTHLRNPI